MPSVDPELLRHIPIFAELDVDALRALADLAYLRRCKPGEVIVHQESVCDVVYVIVGGKGSVSLAAREGRQTVLRDVGPTDFIGEVSLFDGGRRSATVTAITKSELIAIDRAVFLSFLESHPKIAVGLLGVLASRLRRITVLVDDLAGLPVRARLAKCLIGLFSMHGQQVGRTRIRLVQKVSQESLARRVAVTRESVNKHLRHLERTGIVAKEHGYLVVSDMDKLREEARLT